MDRGLIDLLRIAWHSLIIPQSLLSHNGPEHGRPVYEFTT